MSRVKSKVRFGICSGRFTAQDLEYCALCTTLVPELEVNLATK